MFGALQPPPASGRERIGTRHYYPGKKNIIPKNIGPLKTVIWEKQVIALAPRNK